MLTFSFLLSFRHLLLGAVILCITFTFSFISYTDVEDYLARLISHCIANLFCQLVHSLDTIYPFEVSNFCPLHSLKEQ